jgi:hypothetical protein
VIDAFTVNLRSGGGSNLVTTVMSALTVTVQLGPVPEHPPPLQAPRDDPLVGVAFRTMTVPVFTVTWHVPEAVPFVIVQLMPPPTTVPLPVPVPGLTVSMFVGGGLGLNVAVTDWFALRVTEQPPVPEQPAPLHPPNKLPVAALALRATVVPPLTVIWHVPLLEPPVIEQLMPPPLTVPVPVPPALTVRVYCGGLNVAVMVTLLFTVALHVPVPEHAPPLQPPNVLPPVGVAVRDIAVPCWTVIWQVPLSTPFVMVQLRPPPATVPLPAPPEFTVTVRGGGGLNDAVTAASVVSTMVHVPVPLHPLPVQPANVLPPVAVAESVTLLPALTVI